MDKDGWVTVEYRDAAGKYHGASYRKSDLSRLFAKLHASGIAEVYVDDVATPTNNQSLSGV